MSTDYVPVSLPLSPPLPQCFVFSILFLFYFIPTSKGTSFFSSFFSLPTLLRRRFAVFAVNRLQTYIDIILFSGFILFRSMLFIDLFFILLSKLILFIHTFINFSGKPTFAANYHLLPFGLKYYPSPQFIFDLICYKIQSSAKNNIIIIFIRLLLLSRNLPKTLLKSSEIYRLEELLIFFGKEVFFNVNIN